MIKILVLYHSRLGSVEKLASLIARGVESVEGVEAVIRTVPNVSSNTEADESSIPESGAPYASLDDLKNCDGLLMGSPTRFGNMSAELKHFLDSTSAIWMSGDLQGKPAAVFSSSSSMHGGQESTLLSMMNPLLHHGMLIVGLPYSEKSLSKTVTGGTPYGATHVAGNNNQNAISDDEKTLSIALGKRVASIAKKLSD
ncbi:MAG: NAD(P)H:quinone oxidoreductase [Arenicella sp.]